MTGRRRLRHAAVAGIAVLSAATACSASTSTPAADQTTIGTVSADTTPDTAATRPTPMPPGTADNPATIVVLGGSTTQQIGLALADALGPTTGYSVTMLADTDVVAFGDTSLGVDLAEQWRDTVATHRPDMVLVGARIALPDACPEASCTDDELTAAFLTRFGEISSTLTLFGADVVWLQYPPFDTSDGTLAVSDRRAGVADTAALVHAARDRSFTVFETRAVIGDTYQRWVGQPGVSEQLRHHDGIHYCPAGVEIVVEELVAQIAAGASNPEWRHGSWRDHTSFGQLRQGDACTT